MITKVTWPKIVDLLITARNRLVIIMPAIHEEWVETIKQNRNLKFLDIWVCVDNNETVIRNGYGSLKSLEELRKIGAIIKEYDGQRINFIATDNQAFCLFLESRILAGDPNGLNALELDKQYSETIINEFFPEYDTSGNSIEIDFDAIPIDEEKFVEIKKSIEKNPPEEPDLKRKISTYNTLFQYAELHFEGGNLSSKTITIPPDSLPFKDVELKKRIKARISLFSEEITKKWTELSDIKLEVEKVRKEFLVTCNIRKEKSILKKEKKLAFQKAVEKLKKVAEEKTKLLQDRVQTAINNSEDTLRNELSAFFSVNPPDGLQELNPENVKRKIDKEINNILFRIKLPDAASLISKMKLDVMYYELTWEDLNDDAFNQWFVTKGLISKEENDKIANFSSAFEIRK